MKTLGTWAVIDEESLSTEPNAALYSIGATMVKDLDIVDRFYVNIDPQSCLDVGLHQSQSTMEWWAKQGKAAQDVLLTDRVPLRQALQMWSDWIAKHGGKSVRLMGNGPRADNQWLDSAYKACGMENPTPYWNDIDHRTLNWIGGAWLGLSKDDVKFKGVKHHAGDDAEHEAQHAIMVLQRVRQALVLRNAKQESEILRHIGADEQSATTGATMNSKQEFILNNITETVRAGRVVGLVDLAEQLSQVYDIAADNVRIEQVELPSATIDAPVAPLSTNQPLIDTTPQQVGSLVLPTESTEPTPIVEEKPTLEPLPTNASTADDAERTHDDWGLPYSDEWHVKTRSVNAPGQFKRKPGTNEEEYATYMAAQVSEAIASGTFKGPENWAAAIGIAKYLNPVKLTAETIQPVVETVAEAVMPEIVVPETAAPVLQQPVIGASAAAEIPDMNAVMRAHMSVCQTFGVSDVRSKSVLGHLDAANIMQIPENKRAWFVAACNAVVANADAIKSDASSELLKTVLDTVTA
ncbi:ribonuclease H-like domain protein [Vibrio phage 13VV501A]|nr:ribonuclease H-like domain protein [Vibrio phage 13VV501A]